ncbi:hypothetical protein GmHk_17G049447 [Glycine max]|nr:hypothetical protein GmHk_17G049447 [Glycine max]
MTITLDDVFCLLHLLVRDRSIDHVPSTFDRDTVKILLMTHLGILPEIRLQRRQAQVLGNKIFVNKSSSHIHVAYLQYLGSLDACHEYIYGVVALVYHYDHFSYASQYDNKQVNGYMALLMMDVVIWYPYDSHGVRPFTKQALFSGFIRCKTDMWPYHPKKVLRQFRHVQRIPGHPPPHPTYQLCDKVWLDWQ